MYALYGVTEQSAWSKTESYRMSDKGGVYEQKGENGMKHRKAMAIMLSMCMLVASRT